MVSSLDEPARPSTWQLLFGTDKKQNASNNNDHGADETRETSKRGAQTRGSPQDESPTTVSGQLLKALKARETQTPDDAIGRECSEELLGRHNACVPQLRADELAFPVATESAQDGKDKAREIIQSRMRVDKHAEAIRQGKSREQLRREDMRIRPTTSGPTIRSRAEPGQGMTERLQKLREIQQRREAHEKAKQVDADRQRRQQDVREARAATTSRVTATTTTKAVERVAQLKASTSATPHQQRHERAGDGTRTLHKPATRARQSDRLSPTQQPPMSNQEDAASKLVKANARQPKHSPTEGHQQQQQPPAAKPLHTREYRLLDEKLSHLQQENQHAAAMEGKMQRQQQVLRIKRRVWAIWHDRVERRQRQGASVARAFQWRLLQRLWAAWRQYARAAARARAAELTRVQLVREKQSVHVADRFHRLKQLPVWFQHWRLVTSARREARAFDAEMQHRREKAQRLVEQLARAKGCSREPPAPVNQRDASDDTSPSHHAHHSQHDAAQARPAKQLSRDVKAKVKIAWTADALPKTMQLKGDKPSEAKTHTPSAAVPSPDSASPQQVKPKSAPSPDAFYVSMQERAAQRKLHREQLRLKYEALEQIKRDTLALQVAEREAQREQQKRDERERLKEKKREEARLAREKAALREVETIKRQSAALHDRLRLLFHYAWRPWQQQWLASQRVARTAAQWHRLRESHRTWHAWLRFVDARRAQRRHLERERLQRAADHHARVLQAAVLAQWKLAKQATQQRAVAVARQVRWNELLRSWRRWHQTYVVTVNAEQRHEERVRRQLETRRLRSLVAAWRQVAAESRRERVRRAEKEQLWRKARMWLND